MSATFLKAQARALAWLRDSGIQAPSGADAGGVYSWLDEERHASGYLYSEITGYFLTLTTELARLDPQADWQARAVRAAQWLTTRAVHPSGGLLCRKYPPGEGAADPFAFDKELAVFFDSAMVGYGLCNLFRLSGDPQWLAAARRLGDFCRTHFVSPDGSTLHWAYDLGHARPLPDAERWSQHFGPFALKGALFFDTLAQLSEVGAYRDLSDRLLAAALPLQEAKGRFVTSYPHRRATHLHPHLYTVEGLLYLAAHRGRADLLEPAQRAIDWAVRTCLLMTPPLQQWSEAPSERFVELRSDVLAQTLRAQRVLQLLAPKTRFVWEPELPRLWERLEAFALPSGGTAYGRDEHRIEPHANAWCHFFALEAQLFRSREALAAQAFVLT